MSIIREILKENGITIEDLIKVKESFKKNVLSSREFREMLYLRDEISRLEFVKKTIINGYFELSSDRNILNFSIVRKYRVEEIFPDKVVVYIKYNDNDSKYEIEKVVVFLSNELRTMDELNGIIRKTFEYVDSNEIKQIYNQVERIRELMNDINMSKFNSVDEIDNMINNYKSQLDIILKEKPFVTEVEMEKHLLDKNDEIIIKLNNMKFDKRFYDLYFKEDVYNGFFRGNELRIVDFVEMLLNNIDSY